MAIIETGFYPTRRDLLTLGFSRRSRSHGQKPPRRPRETHLAQPQPPNWGPRIPRRIFIAGGTVVVGAATLISRPWEWFRSPDEKIREGWLRLPPKDRITRLEFKNYPGFSDFNSETEMINASAQYYCSVLACSPEVMRRKVLLTNTERIIEEIEIDNERKLTDQEKQKYGGATTEMFGEKRGFILINRANLIREANKYLQQKEAKDEMGGRDAYTVMLKSTLFHAYTHANVSQEEVAFNDLIIPSQVPVVYNKMGHGFTFLGKRATGETVFQHGGDEALTDYVATAIGQETGPYLSGPTYTAGVRLIYMLNTRAGLNSMDDLLAYYTGRKPKMELFRRWGAIKNPNQPSEQSALAVLLTIALRVDNPQDITQEQAVTKINELLRP